MARGRPFQKGQSGNPSGRPKDADAEVKQLAKAHTAEAVETLAGIMRDAEEDSRARVSACNALLDRAWGKPSQAVELDARLHMPTAVRIITPLTSQGEDD